MTVGNTGPAGATFACKVDGGGPVRVAVADNPGMTSPVFTASQAVDAQGVAKVSITGLDPSARYWWQVEDNGTVDTAVTGQFLTHPPLGLAGTFTLGIVADAGLSPVTPGVGAVLAADRLSNAPVLDLIRGRALAEDWLMGCWLGDDVYYDLGSGDWGIVGGASLANYRRARDDRLLQPRHHQLDRQLPNLRLKDDHDGAQNNHDSTDAGTHVYNQVYREVEPHPPLPDTDTDGGIYWSLPICRTLLIGADVRTFKEETAGAMLGAAQLAWMDELLAGSGAEFVLWLMPGQWMGSDADTWASHPAEQADVIAMFGDHGYAGRVAIIGADAHIVALDTGANSPGGIPVLQAAAIDATPGFGNPAAYDLGGQAGRNQYGTVRVDDLGSSIAVRLSGWHNTTLLVSHQIGITVATAPVIASGALLRTLTGSHTPLLEARVVTGHPTGDDPDGEEIPILGGDVVYDGTAEVRATLSLGTLGISDATGRSTYPRFATDLLSPVRGAEIFVRYGLDLGGSILWTPLGYYRIEDDDQGEAPYGGITLAGKDRMAAIIEGNLLSPRLYPATRAVGTIVEDLVTDIYPGAQIAWDDNSDLTALGRVLVVEESRYEALREIAVSTGKLMYWDDTGVLRFEAAPDEDNPVWEVRSGRGGVLVSASRRVSRQDVVNGWVVVGQGADDLSRVRSVAVDNNPQSPTYFFGNFGQVVRRFESPLISNQPQADTASVALLRRSLGAPHEVELVAVTNPTLRPWQPARATYRDGNRDVVIMQRVRVPLARVPMTGAGRTRILAAIGSV
jgi:hypothetical protein